jgi:hypothetical protein
MTSSSRELEAKAIAEFAIKGEHDWMCASRAFPARDCNCDLGARREGVSIRITALVRSAVEAERVECRATMNLSLAKLGLQVHAQADSAVMGTVGLNIVNIIRRGLETALDARAPLPSVPEIPQ